MISSPGEKKLVRAEADGRVPRANGGRTDAI
jgi:hypothetical protein